MGPQNGQSNIPQSPHVGGVVGGGGGNPQVYGSAGSSGSVKWEGRDGNSASELHRSKEAFERAMYDEARMHPDITVVIGVLNQFEITIATVEYLISKADRPAKLDIVFLDNGSDSLFHDYFWSHRSRKINDPAFTFVNETKNKGNYPYLIEAGLRNAHSESKIVAFFHSDLFITQQGWDTALIAQFDANPNLGLVGFIGSTQIDGFGGRGMGTHSNFQGNTYPKPSGEGAWQGSPASVHGKPDAGFIIDGAVVDGCAMVFRKSVLKDLPIKTDYPPHHFYDRLLSLQVREAGFKVGILGIACDHISGQVANHENSYHSLARAWAMNRYKILEPSEWVNVPENEAWFKNPTNPSKGHIPNGWDHVVYLSAEKLFLEEYRDVKHIIPVNC